jgi:HEAT repeat protein
VEPLVAALKHPDDHWLRHYAAEALGQIGDTRAVEPLVAALTDLDSTCARLPPGRWRRLAGSSIGLKRESRVPCRRGASGLRSP